MMKNFYIDLSSELNFATSRSGGKGGQNVNKTSTKVELRFNVLDSALLNETQKQTITHRLKHRITADGDILVTVQETRSQLQNKEIAIEKFYALIDKCFEVKKKRKATKPSKASKEKRIKDKKKRAEKKQFRREY